MPAEDSRVFLSAVTSEFGTARDAIGADLRARGHRVILQSDFRQGPDSKGLLDTLYNNIRDCSAVVCIVGKRSGELPPQTAADRVARLAPLPARIAQASCTQWEYFIARHFQRRLYVYIANDDYRPDRPEPAGSDALQDAFVAYLKDQNVHYTPFSNVDQLGRAVLKETMAPELVVAKGPVTKPIVLPYQSLGPLFKGRDEFLQRLRASLTRKDGGPTAIVSQALYGLGGIGKTRAAVEYAWAHAHDYNALLFVVAETPEALRRNLAGLAGALVPTLDTTDDQVRLQAVRDWLAANPGWFLILDNVDSKPALKEVERLLGGLAGGHVVVTSRLADFSGNFQPLELDVLALDDAVAFLLARTEGRRRVAVDDAAKARAVAAELGRLALALEQAAAYVSHRKTFGDYLKQWRENSDAVLAWFDATVTGYPRAVAVTWQTSVAQLSEGGRRLLERLAWLAPEKVPEFLLDVPILGAEAENLHGAFDDLAAYSLVTRDAEGPFFLVHRLVQDVTRRRLGGEARQRSLVEALNWISGAFIGNPDDVRDWPKLEPLAPHAKVAADHDDATDAPEATSELLRQVGWLLTAKALYAEGEPMLRRALAIIENAPDNANVASCLTTLAHLLQATNRLAEAEPLMRRALAIDETSFGSDHPDFGRDLNNLAQLLQATNRLAEAEPLMRRALAIDETSFGPDHPNVAIRLNNLAVLLQATDRLAEAEPLMRRMCSIFVEFARRTRHPHPNFETAFQNYAILLDTMGEGPAEIEAALAALKQRLR